MDVASLKTYIYDEDLSEQVLESIGCHSIRRHGNDYITCGNKDGDNQNAITLYLNENLTVVNYTRCLSKTKRTTDIIDLVMFNEDLTFPEALKFLCNELGLEYYSNIDDIPESLKIIKFLQEMNTGSEMEEEKPLKPINEKVLDYYLRCGNILFEDDGISLETQKEWEIGYDSFSNSVTIPIRDELGNLIAVKARRFKYTKDTPIEKRRFNSVLRDDESKYFFLEPGAKSQILYGLYKNGKAIQRQGVVYVGESEKFCMQLYDMGYFGVSIGGSKLSKRQVEMLTRLGVKIILCFDKDINEEKLNSIANMFIDGISIYAILDKDGVLAEKESPSDNKDKWLYLIKNNIYRIKQ